MPRILLLALVTVATPSVGQSAEPLVQRVAWPLADFVVLGDSTHGVQLVASPNLRSEQGRARHDQSTLSLDPLAARHWARGVAAIVDSVARITPNNRTPFETVPLAANLGQSRVLISFDGKGPRERALERATFAPGREDGRAVSAVVWQWFRFRVAR